MPQLIIVRHGQSVWNLENRFTGEADVDLTPLGREEARSAGKKLTGIAFSKAFTSVLKRAEETLALILETSGHSGLPVIRDKALNERNYGQLQGLNKAETAQKYGEQQVLIWRRSFAVRPPGGESLQDTAARVMPFYRLAIEPLLTAGEDILIVAHGNSLRALMMELEHIGEDAITGMDIPTGMPRCYTFNPKMELEKAEYL
jgi:2,3-bisphosphoglycerate-dependent phosphoglycerate mutase